MNCRLFQGINIYNTTHYERTLRRNEYEKVITKDPAGALDALSENASIYAGIILNKTDGLSPQQRDSYQDLQRVQGAPSYLLLMYLIKNQALLQMSCEDIVKICKKRFKSTLRNTAGR